MRITPLLSSTKRGTVPWEWVPLDFSAFVQELLHIVTHCRDIDHLALFRGHRDKDWLLDCTFVRYVKEHVLGVPPNSNVRADYRDSISYQRLMGELLLYKFGTRTIPHWDLLQGAEVKGYDPWFEYMKRIQQYPEEDLSELRGSFLIDWSQRPDVAVYFANDSRSSDMDGAVWVADISAMGPVLHQDRQVADILRIIQERIEADKALGIPLIFSPRKQITCVRAMNQDVIYAAQMDLRYDLATMWKRLESEQNGDEAIVLKLVLPRGTEAECSAWLETREVNKAFIFPYECSD